jgi:hypothetical protein
MDPNTIPQRDNKGNTCEAVGCASNATTELNVKVGDLGTIGLLLCNECIPRFADSQLIGNCVSSKNDYHRGT